MNTPFDLASVMVFAALCVLYLHRSASAKRDPVPLWGYGLLAVGCALGDVLGDRGLTWAGAALVAASAMALVWVLLRRSPS